jgi:hypothetical protein
MVISCFFATRVVSGSPSGRGFLRSGAADAAAPRRICLQRSQFEKRLPAEIDAAVHDSLKAVVRSAISTTDR